MVGGAKQHRLSFQRSAGLAIGEHASCDKAGLIGIVGDRDQHGKGAMRPIGSQSFGEAFRRERDDRVGRGKDGRRSNDSCARASQHAPAGSNERGKSRMLRTVAARKE